MIYDFVILGAGAAGITLALDLSKKNKDVSILGGMAPRTPSLPRTPPEALTPSVPPSLVPSSGIQMVLQPAQHPDGGLRQQPHTGAVPHTSSPDS